MRNSPGSGRLKRLLDVLAGAERVLVVTHDNPDPDAIAAAWGLVRIVEAKLACPAHAFAGGAIARAENRTLVDLLRPPLSLVEDLPVGPEDRVIVVDTCWPARLHNVANEGPFAALIDHHAYEALGVGRGRGQRLRFRYRDVRPKVVACSSIIAGYLRAAGLDPGPELATALLYGVHTDAKGHDARFTAPDRSAIAWLSQHSDPSLRAQIDRAPLSREYFADLLLALENTFVYEDAAVCFLPSAAGGEVVGELADLLMRCEGVRRVLCAAEVAGRLIFSARTTAAGGDAAVLLRATLEGSGSCGGHRHRAGGYMVLRIGSGSLEDVESRLRAAFLSAAGVAQHRGTRLVAKREILRVLT